MEDAKWCFVPTCLNSTRNTVNKWFVPIPVKPKRREQWFKAVNRNYCPNSERSTLYCCSDHFNLDEDAGSFCERDGEVVVKLKKSIVPRLTKTVSESLKPMPPSSSVKEKFYNNASKINCRTKVTSKTSVPQSHPSEVVSLIDESSSEDEDHVDVVGVVASDPTEPRKALMEQRLSSMKQSGPKASGKSTGQHQPSRQTGAGSSRSPKKQTNTSQSLALVSPQSAARATKTLFDSLRKCIPSISTQQGLTREQILTEAVDFILQMRHKSDTRQGTMHFIMDDNSTLKAKISHLENLISLHEKNEITLTKEIIDRRLGAVTAQAQARTSRGKNKQ